MNKKDIEAGRTLLFENQIMRINDVSKLIGCSRGHIYNLVSKDEIPYFKKGKFLFFFYSDILNWIKE
ncbi:MAG: helix-turn-helix domain-containing protein [Halobacteriovoraceae bacterium]|jgi:excisionase family DNA binding protein|nr:helix-turn-helix domain-containing protein [Halobacteriovoraceae bacterium]